MRTLGRTSRRFESWLNAAMRWYSMSVVKSGKSMVTFLQSKQFVGPNSLPMDRFLFDIPETVSTTQFYVGKTASWKWRTKD